MTKKNEMRNKMNWYCRKSSAPTAVSMQ